jgi:tetratricopeptide (TPR) repeat protein
MRTLLSVFAAIIVVTTGMAYADKFSVDLNLKKPEAAAKEAEADGWFNKGNTAYQANNYDEAITCYKKAAEIDPAFASAYYNLGIIYAKRKQPEEAISAYKKVLTIDPAYHAARNNLASLYIQKGMIDEAISELEKAVAGSADFAHAHYNLAECYLKKGNKTLAADHYHKAGVLFVEKGDTVWAQRSYDNLMRVDAGKQAKDLLDTMNAGPKQKPIAVDQVIEIPPKAK